jgi:hypothetical protein
MQGKFHFEALIYSNLNSTKDKVECIVDNHYKEGLSAVSQPKVLQQKNSEVHSSL